jgi:TolB-like protein
VPETVDERFARHVTAVLVAERDPDPPLAAADQATAVGDAVAFLRVAGGDSEPLAPNAVVSVFDDAAAGLTAATRLHLRVASEGGDQSRRAWRAGLHVGEVVLTGEATASLAAIDRAAALARMARPGTTAIAAAVIPVLGRLREATLEPLEQHTTEGQVHLVVPSRTAPAPARRRALVVLLGGVALAGVGGVAWIALNRQLSASKPRRLTLGVGPFRASGSEEAGTWMGPALREGLSAQLSELTGVRVFSDEFMDFVVTREGLTTIELANRLGIEKVVSGTVVVGGGRVHVEARIIDVASGLLEGAYIASGQEGEFLALERDLVLGVIARLDVRLSPQDEARLAVQQTTDLDSVRRLLEGEGAGGSPPGPDPDPTGDGEPRSSPWDRFAPRLAFADDVDAAIAAALEAYRVATEARDVTALGALYADLPAGQRTALERYFDNVRDLRVAIDLVEVAVIGDEAVVNFTRTDDFTDVPSGRQQHVTVRLTKTLRRIDGRWHFIAGR